MRDHTSRLIDLFAALSLPGEFSLSPDGSAIAFTQEVTGYSQIFTMPVRSAAALTRVTATLTDCVEPHWSSDGTRLAFVRDQAIWVANADGTQARELTSHPAGNSNPSWSPEGACLAFFSRRRGWHQLWTIPSAGGTPTPITPAEFDAVNAVWSPDSETLAYCSVRENDLTTRGIYLVPSDGGVEELISPRGCWSGAPHFSPDGRTLAYLSDHDGWHHVYLYDRQMGTTRQLTRGDFEDLGLFYYTVDPSSGPVFSPDGKHLAFIRNCGGRFDVWAADVKTGQARRVSREDGHHRIVGWLPNSNQLVVTFDRAGNAPSLWLLALDGELKRLTDWRVAEMRAEDFEIRPEWIEYPARDGLTIHAAMFRAREAAARAPAVIFVHGGPSFQFGDFFYPLPQLLAHEGYVVLAPNVRGSTGYGVAFRNANICEWGHADAFDVIDAARWLQAQSFVDPARIAVVGPSYGGYLTLCALTRAPELFCAGVDMYGDSEIAESFHHGDRYGRLDLQRQMGKPEDNPEGYRRGSPVYLAERLQAPLLLLHGKKDMLVVPAMSERMIEALKIENKYFESHFYEEEGHGFEKPENRKDAWTRVVKFLNRHCKGEKEK